MRRHAVFKFINYITDKITRVVLTTLALMLRCVQTKCVSEGETESGRQRVGYVLSVHNKTEFCGKNTQIILLFTVFICLASVVVDFDYFSVIRPLK